MPDRPLVARNRAMSDAPTRERIVAWTLIGVAMLVAVVATADAWRRVGHITPGFNLMANLQTGVGDRGGVEPFGQILAVDGQPVRTHAELSALVDARPPGTEFRYAMARNGRSEERAIPSRLVSVRDFKHFLLDSLLPGLLILMIAATVSVLRPDAADSWLFLGFCLLTSLESIMWTDFNTTHRFAGLFLAVWAFTPAVFTHLALAFPERSEIARRKPWIVWLPYAPSLVLATLLQFLFLHEALRVAEVTAVYWALSLLTLLLSLARTGIAGA